MGVPVGHDWREGRYISNHLSFFNNLKLQLWGGKKKRRKSLLVANWSIFSRSNVASVGGWGSSRTSFWWIHQLSRKLILKDLLYRRVTGMGKEMEKFCKTCLTRTVLRRHETSANTGITSADSNFCEGKWAILRVWHKSNGYKLSKADAHSAALGRPCGGAGGHALKELQPVESPCCKFCLRDLSTWERPTVEHE